MMSKPKTLFEYQADMNVTKHMGGQKASEELVGMCGVNKDSYGLDIGCGVGATPCYMAKQIGCRVVGVDLSQAMIDRSIERAREDGVDDLVEFRVADAQELPFDNELFDVVMAESVTVFPPDKPRALSEYTRVTKIGGVIGLNESTFVKEPVPLDVVDWVSRDLSSNAEILTANEWVGLMAGAGLEDIESRVYDLDLKDEVGNVVGRYGWGTFLGTFIWALKNFIRDPGYRLFLKSIGGTPPHITEYYGYGLYAGRKVAR